MSHEREVEEDMKVSWRNLGVAPETIYEDEGEDEDETETEDDELQSPSLSSPSSPFQSGVDAWTEATGRKPDVKILVRGVCFHLHKDVLVSKSCYFKRHLTRVSEFTLSPPLKVTADTFKQVADFCYTNYAVITPSNVVSLRITAQLLEMDGIVGEESLRELTESYFREVAIVNKTVLRNVFRSSLLLLPEAEQTAFIASRCIETLLDDGEGDGGVSCADGLKTVSPEGIRVIAESMQGRYTASHDLLYRVIDLYFLVYNGKMSEEQKTQITSCIDCSILSPALLMHAVQNPRMPLRFIVQAMLIEQLNTHRSLFSVFNPNTTTVHDPRMADSPATLGAILERDAALRQVTQLRSAIDTTCSRIQSLEKELCGMKKLLKESEREKLKGSSGGGGSSSASLLLDDQRRVSSCRFNSSNNNKVERGERGSISSSFLRFGGNGNSNSNSGEFCEMKLGGSSCLDDKNDDRVIVKRNLGQRLIKGLRNAFKVSNSNSKVKDNGRFDGGMRRGRVLN